MLYRFTQATLAVLFISAIVASSAYAAKLIRVDGSSTVYPITEAVAEEYQKENRKFRVTVGISGTGGGFKKFGRGEIDISDASRPIKPTEVELCAKNGIEYIELPVAYDGLAVIVHPQNNWVDYFTVDELRTLWEPDAQGKIIHWNEIRPEWPNKKFLWQGPELILVPMTISRKPSTGQKARAAAILSLAKMITSSFKQFLTTFMG